MSYKLTKKINKDNAVVIHQSDSYNESWMLEIKDKNFEFLIDSQNELPPSNVYEDEKNIFFELNNKVFLFSKINGNVLFVTQLFDDFSVIKCGYNKYIIVTDTTVLVISKHNFTVLKVAFFPDIIMTIEIKEEKIVLQTLGEGDFEIVL